MQKLRTSIFSNLKSSQAKQYIDKNILSTVKNYSTLRNDSTIRKSINSNDGQMYMYSRIQNFKNIKPVIQSIENRIVVGGLYASFKQIEQLQDKLKQLQANNIRIKAKINLYQLSSNDRKQFKKSKKQQNLSILSYNQQKPSYSQQLQKARYRFQQLLLKKKVLSLARLSKQQITKKLNLKRHQFYETKSRIEGLQQKVQQAYTICNQKVDSIYNQIQKLQNQLNDKNQQLFFHKHNKAKYQQESVGSLKQSEQLRQIKGQVQNLQNYITNEQTQKSNFQLQLNQYNLQVQQQKQKNKQLRTRLINKFADDPSKSDYIIDRIIRFYEKDSNKNQFLLQIIERGLKYHKK